MAIDDGTTEAPDQAGATSDPATGDAGIPEPPPPALPTVVESVHGSNGPGGGSPTPQLGNPKIHIST